MPISKNRVDPMLTNEDDDDESGGGDAGNMYQTLKGIQEGHEHYGEILNPAVDPEIVDLQQRVENNLEAHPLLTESAQFSANQEDPHGQIANENAEAVMLNENSDKSELELSLKQRQELQLKAKAEQRLRASHSATMRPM